MKRWIRTIPGKVTLFLVTLLSLALAVVSALGAVLMLDSELYTTPKETAYWNTVEGYAMNDAHLRISEQEGYMVSYITGGTRNSFRYILYNSDGKAVKEYTGEGADTASPRVYFAATWHSAPETISGERQEAETYDAEAYNTVILDDTVYLSSTEPFDAQAYLKDHQNELLSNQEGDLPVYLFYGYLVTDGNNDVYAMYAKLIDLLYALRYSIYVIGAVALAVTVVGYVALLCVSGRRPDTEKLVLGPLHRVPIDVMLALCALVPAGLFAALINTFFITDFFQIGLLVALSLLSAGVCLGLSMSIACRIKDRSLLRNTAIWRLCKVLWWGFKGFFRACRKLLRQTVRASRKLPLVWRSFLGLFILCVVELLAILASDGYMETYLGFWFVEHLLLVPAVLYGALTLRELKAGGEALANGDLSYQVDTHGMYWDFKQHGENLNSIAEGMTRAVEQRLKSERMKTELITNVSHDIKTPLTSIINYADLIGKESCDNPKIGEYAEVLGRQSVRLKRLIEDLVEASKASTGNLEVLLAPCDAENFLVQISGEFSQKLSDAGLELITTVPEQSLRVMADGRRMLRVFDNLMNNICKYAQRGTRVYLTLEEREGMAQITFRNTSSAPLNLTPEELMERFVRGDSARSSDGNGLGLSIARSLTELQRGSFQLDVDGDLFKVTLRFPLLPNA